MPDVVSLVLNGKTVRNIVSYSLKYDLFQGAASFEAEIDFDYILPLQAYTINYTWMMNGTPVMVGVLDKVDKTYSKTQRTLKISGRDYCGVLIDSYIVKPTHYENKTLDKIISDIVSNNVFVSAVRIKQNTPEALQNPLVVTVANPTQSDSLMFSSDTIAGVTNPTAPINIEYSSAARQQMTKVGPLTQVRTEYGQTLFDALSGICNSVGLYMYNPAGTQTILIHAWNGLDKEPVSYDKAGAISKDTPYSVTNKLRDSGGNNVISCQFTEDVSKFYRFIKIVGQTQSELSLDPGTGLYESKQNTLVIEKLIGLADNGLPSLQQFGGPVKFLSKEINSADGKAWTNTRDELMHSQLMEQNRQLYSLKYTLAGHSAAGTTPYNINHLVTINDDLIPMTNATFLVYGLEFSGDKNRGYQTVMTCCLPDGRNSYIDQTFGNSKWELGFTPGATENSGVSR